MIGKGPLEGKKKHQLFGTDGPKDSKLLKLVRTLPSVNQDVDQGLIEILIVDQMVSLGSRDGAGMAQW